MKRARWIVLLLFLSLSTPVAAKKPGFKFWWSKHTIKHSSSYYVYITTDLPRRYRLRCSFKNQGRHLLTMDVLTVPGEKGRMLVTGMVGRAFNRLECRHT